MRIFALLYIILLVAITVSAQKSDTAFLSASTAYSKQLYTAATKTEWPLNIGGQYALYASIEGEHPYFVSAWTNGSVQYFGDVYHDVPLLLDIRADKLVTRHTQYDVEIELSLEKVKYFTLGSYQFVNLHQDTIQGLPESGYYQLLQPGKVSLLARRKKIIKRSMSSGKLTAIVNESTRYYIVKDGAAIAVSSRRSLLHALQDRPDLKAQVRKSKLKFGKKREAGLAGIVRIYNELIR
jgi:hypothetical protein